MFLQNRRFKNSPIFSFPCRLEWETPHAQDVDTTIKIRHLTGHFSYFSSHNFRSTPPVPHRALGMEQQETHRLVDHSYPCAHGMEQQVPPSQNTVQCPRYGATRQTLRLKITISVVASQIKRRGSVQKNFLTWKYHKNMGHS